MVRARPSAGVCAGEARPHDAHLFDDLPGLEVASESEPPCRAEGACERAPHLGAHTHREAPRALKGNTHGLDPLAVVCLEQILHERIDGALALGENLERGNVPTRPERLHGDSTNLVQWVGQRAAARANDDGHDLAGFAERELRKSRHERVRSQSLQGMHVAYIRPPVVFVISMVRRRRTAGARKNANLSTCAPHASRSSAACRCCGAWRPG